ncbi:MAG: PilZ domain-containing protein [Planctomycetota bacterium]
MPHDAHAHFSGKRQTERRVLDARVELVGGGVTIHGRAVDVSTGGVAVRLAERTLQGFKEATDAISAFRVIERHFTSGVVVRFPVHGDIRIPARVVRVVAAPKAGGELSLGLKFARPLGADEWARITETRRPTPIPALAPVRNGPPIQVLVTDPESGPICLLRAVRGASSFVEGRVDAQRPIAAVELRGALGVEARPTRVQLGDATLWSGDAIARDVHASSTDGLCVTLETASPLPDAFLRRLGRTS